jgi:hypothetical protein
LNEYSVGVGGKETDVHCHGSSVEMAMKFVASTYCCRINLSLSVEVGNGSFFQGYLLFRVYSASVYFIGEHYPYSGSFIQKIKGGQSRVVSGTFRPKLRGIHT